MTFLSTPSVLTELQGISLSATMLIVENDKPNYL